MNPRREFLKKFGLLTGGAAVAVATPSFAQGKSGNGDALDDLVLEVNNNSENWQHRQVRDHQVNWSYAGVPVSIKLHDSESNTGDDDWSVELYSDNLADLAPQTSGNVMGTNSVPEDRAEQDYTMTYMAPDVPGGHHGILRTVNEEIDRYMTHFTITYKVNGNQETLEFNAPNSVTKKIFGWDPGEDIPWFPFVAYNRDSNPADFENAFNNLHEILTSSDYAVQNSRLTNRNTPSPCPDPNPWYGDAAVLEALAADPLTVDELYPTDITVDMTDFKKYGSLAPEEKEKADAKYLDKAIVTGAGMAGARKLVDNIKNFKMPGSVILIK